MYIEAGVSNNTLKWKWTVPCLDHYNFAPSICRCISDNLLDADRAETTFNFCICLKHTSLKAFCGQDTFCKCLLQVFLLQQNTLPSTYRLVLGGFCLLFFLISTTQKAWDFFLCSYSVKMQTEYLILRKFRAFWNLNLTWEKAAPSPC